MADNERARRGSPVETEAGSPRRGTAPLPGAVTPVPDTSTSLRGAPTLVPRPGMVKGTQLISRMKFLRARGPVPVHEVLNRLSDADQETLQGILLPTSWYDNELLLRLEGAMAAVIARGDRARVFAEMGQFAAETNLGPAGVQRPYVREGDPHHLLDRVPRMYLSQHSTGRRTYHRTGDRSADIRTLDADAAVPEDCLMVAGWLHRAIELCGGHDVRVVETRCRARGDDLCEYRCSWASG